MPAAGLPTVRTTYPNPLWTDRLTQWLTDWHAIENITFPQLRRLAVKIVAADYTDRQIDKPPRSWPQLSSISKLQQVKNVCWGIYNGK